MSTGGRVGRGSSSSQGQPKRSTRSEPTSPGELHRISFLTLHAAASSQTPSMTTQQGAALGATVLTAHAAVHTLADAAPSTSTGTSSEFAAPLSSASQQSLLGHVLAMVELLPGVPLHRLAFSFTSGALALTLQALIWWRRAR